MLGLRGLLGERDEPVAFVATGEHALGAALAELAHLSGGREPNAPGPRGGDAGEVLRKILQALDHPRVRQQPPGELEHRGGPAEQVQQPERAVGGRRRDRPACSRLSGWVGRVEVGEQRARPVGAGAIEQRLRPADVCDERRVQAPAEGGRERELVAIAHLQLLAQASARPPTRT